MEISRAAGETRTTPTPATSGNATARGEDSKGQRLYGRAWFEALLRDEPSVDGFADRLLIRRTGAGRQTGENGRAGKQITGPPATEGRTSRS
ncbi:hypothetical protein GQF42_07435 [Streptomyces broussonetiae]|uniref:Uncharacterized protein n=1 Tax=Streptomyces broussonetiae TaxID=2686304 RepID=A0A6I6MRF3_9ACTN|nr:hypothetical protein [Streptomyces broussonetiae]QHA03128.1 hypothetical protein GQF42_07435 [Streptomyces broussonetiae]